MHLSQFFSLQEERKKRMALFQAAKEADEKAREVCVITEMCCCSVPAILKIHSNRKSLGKEVPFPNFGCGESQIKREWNPKLPV